MKPTYAAFEARVKQLSAAGLRLTLCEEGQHWLWVWQQNGQTVAQGNTDVGTKQMAFFIACTSI